MLTHPAYCIPYPCGSMRSAPVARPAVDDPCRAQNAMLKDPAFVTTRPAAYCSIAGTRGESRESASPEVTRGANATRASPRFDARPESWAFLLPAHLRRRCVWPPAATWRARGTQRAKILRWNRQRKRMAAARGVCSPRPKSCCIRTARASRPAQHKPRRGAQRGRFEPCAPAERRGRVRRGGRIGCVPSSSAATPAGGRPGPEGWCERPIERLG